MSLFDDIRAEAQRAFQAKNPPAQKAILPYYGEIALADARRLFPSGFTAYNPSDLVSVRGMGIFDKMRKDDQIKAALTFKKHAVLSSGWNLEPPEGFTEDWDVLKFVDHALENLDHGEPEGTLEDDLLQILTALDYGFSVSERVHAPIERGPFSGKIGYRALKTRKPHDFDFVTDEFGNLRPDGILQRGNKTERLDRRKFVLFVYQMEFSNWYGRSDLEAAFRDWVAKDNGYKWLMMLMEKFGVPPFFALYNPATMSQYVDKMKDVIQNLQASTGGAIPRPSRDDLELWAPELARQAGSVFMPAIEQFNQGIARAILMPGHLGLSADVSEGSFARAKVNFDVFLLVVEKLRRDLEQRVMMNQVIKPLVDLNYTTEVYPKWRFLPLSDEGKTELFGKWLEAVSAGVVQPQPADEAHIRALTGFPEREAPDLGFSRGRGARRDYVQVRPPNRFERKVDFARIERDLDGVEAEAHQMLREMLTATRDILTGFVERRLPEASASLVNEVQLRNWGDVQGAFREFLRAAYDVGDEAIRRELPKTFQQSPLFAPTEALRWLAQKALTISGVLKERLLGQAKDIILNALKFGEKPRETVAKLQALFEPYVGDETMLREGEPIDPYRLETVLRTVATDAFNQGRLVAVRQPDVARFVRGMQYSAVIDSRTTPVCRFLDRKIFPMGEPELDRLAPANHFGCRSILVPVTLDMEVDEELLITPAQIGQAKELAGQGFV